MPYGRSFENIIIIISRVRFVDPFCFRTHLAAHLVSVSVCECECSTIISCGAGTQCDALQQGLAHLEL